MGTHLENIIFIFIFVQFIEIWGRPALTGESGRIKQVVLDGNT
jgi:hypothetical protein